MRTREVSAGELPTQAGESEVTRQLCAAVYARPAQVGERSPWGESQLLGLIDQVLRDPARSVPSYGFDLVPVLAHGVRARRLRLVRRVAVLLVVALAVAWAPLAALAWIAALGCAFVLGPSGAGWAVLPLVGYWVFALVAVQKHDDFFELWVRSAQLPFLLALALALVHAVDGVVAWTAMGRARRDGAGRERMPAVGMRTRRRMEWIDARQNSTELPYDDQGRFLGAGRDVRGAAELRVPLRPGRPDRALVPLRGAELLESIRATLPAAGEGGGAPGDHTETDPLPGFSVTQVLALPGVRGPERGGVRPGAARLRDGGVLGPAHGDQQHPGDGPQHRGDPARGRGTAHACHAARRGRPRADAPYARASSARQLDHPGV
ncbi:hypothetical protein PV408_37445, partial [Streptomyces sp. ME18-1-4]|nr:hypothetical protein [Streptomyces sp. ME18-1-4]